MAFINLVLSLQRVSFISIIFATVTELHIVGGRSFFYNMIDWRAFVFPTVH